MKAFIKKAGLVIASLVASAEAAANNGDFCSGLPNVAPNSWLVGVNDQNVAEKQDIIDALKLMSSNGFEIKNIIDYETSHDVVIMLTFKAEGLDSTKQTAERDRVIGGLVGLNGISVYCDHISHPFPSVGISN